jgi:hypothetical protein
MGRLAQRGLLLIFVVVFTIGAASSTAPVSMQFYSTTSQIIPLLFIVLAIEVRLFQLPPRRPDSLDDLGTLDAPRRADPRSRAGDAPAVPAGR